jgi:hypothetical protein
MVMICTGDRRSIEHVRSKAVDVFPGDFVSALTFGRDETEAAFHVRPESHLRANAFFDWMVQQRQVGQLPSCHVVELDFLIDGNVLASRSV